MPSEIIIIIIGVVLMLLAASDSLFSKDSSTNIINSKLRVPSGLIGVLLVIYVGFSYGAVNLTGQIEQPDSGQKKPIEYPIESVQIISPIDGESVNCRMLTMGVYPEGHTEDIWVLIRPSDNRYYPQSDHTNTSYKRNGEWQVISRFGGDQGESFDLIVYEVDESASQFFTNTIQSWKEALAYPGLTESEIPKGAKEVDRISVTLTESCREVF